MFYPEETQQKYGFRNLFTHLIALNVIRTLWAIREDREHRRRRRRLVRLL